MPAVAVTVTVEITGGGVDDPPPLLPLPHPLNRLSATATMAKKRNGRMLRRFLKPTKQHKMVESANPALGNSWMAVGRTLLAEADAERVSVVVAAAPDGVTVAGEKVQEVPDGCPEHVKETWDEKPFCGVTVTVAVPLEPEAMVNADGEIAMVKDGGKLMV